MRDHLPLLTSSLAELGISPSREALERLIRLGELLIERNKEVNLTAIDDPRGVVLRHLADSAAVLAHLKGERVIDVGCGAGFPGLPVKILAGDDLKMTMLDSTGKKINFIKEVAGELGLKKVECLNARAEEVASSTPYRQSYSTVLSRAVSRLDMLSELCLPFCELGGVFLPHKGPRSEEELSEALGGIKKLGGRYEGKTAYRTHPDEPEQYVLHIIKEAPTPEAYPRAFAKIRSKPLR